MKHALFAPVVTALFAVAALFSACNSPDADPAPKGDAAQPAPPGSAASGAAATERKAADPATDSTIRLIAAPAIPPQQLCPATGSFGDFRKRFDAAVAGRDATALLALVDSDVRTGFAGDDGIDAFRRTWTLGDGKPGSMAAAKASPLWPVLTEIAALGCGPLGPKEERLFAMPSMYLAEIGTVDAFDALVAKPGAVLRAEPRADARALARFDWTLVSLDMAAEKVAPPKGWRRVKAADGTGGWLSDSDARAPIDYRILFNETPAGWRITALVAGD